VLNPPQASVPLPITAITTTIIITVTTITTYHYYTLLCPALPCLCLVLGPRNHAMMQPLLRLSWPKLHAPALAAAGAALPAPAVARFTTTALLAKNSLPPRPKPPPDSDIEESYLKGSGPGGQKIVRPSSSPLNN
jgi:hypothetical protein